MKRHCTQTFLSIAIPFFILVFPLYLCCSYFEEADLFATDLAFENPDQDDQLVDQQQDGPKGFALTFCPFGFRPEPHVFRHSLHFLSQTFRFQEGKRD